jgi:hypothetical protein
MTDDRKTARQKAVDKFAEADKEGKASILTVCSDHYYVGYSNGFGDYCHFAPEKVVPPIGTPVINGVGIVYYSTGELDSEGRLIGSDGPCALGFKKHPVQNWTVVEIKEVKYD